MAGNGTNGFAGDGGTATNAELNFPSGIALDSVSDLFIADKSNNRIRKVDTNGIITTVVGNGTNGWAGDYGGATNAELYFPFAIALDVVGNLFIADAYDERIRKVDTNGLITTVAGDGYKLLHGLPPAPSGGYSGDGGAAITAELNNPQGIAVDGAGDLFVADTQNGRIRKVSPFSGPTLTLLSVSTFSGGIPAPSGNYEVIITGAFGSVTSSVAQLTFVSPPTGSILENQGIANLTWSAVSGLVYQVQYSTNLVFPNWFNFGSPINATNSVITIPDSATNSQRFYRVLLTP